MFRSFRKRFLPNPLDQILQKGAKRGAKKILLGWNRGLGDIALGLFAIVHRVREIIPDAEITFVTRENLKEGFSMLKGISCLIDPTWKRGVKCSIDPKLKEQFDLTIEAPSPTDWVVWQRGTLVPKLTWDPSHENLYEKFSIPKDRICIALHISAETDYGQWRNWSLGRWQELIDALEKKEVLVLLLGYEKTRAFSNKNVIDLRGKTTLFELLSIVKNCAYGAVVPDSGISSMIYYLDTSFPFRHVTLWADPNHGILKQNVSSPNPSLQHIPLIAKNKDVSSISTKEVVRALFPIEKTGAIILAAGQGTRLNAKVAKGLIEVAGKTLFQWLIEKADPMIPIAIMTSEKNREEIESYFQKHNYFGREISFFNQEEDVLLDENRLSTDQLAPNGNGSVFSSFKKAGLQEVFAKKGVEVLTVTNIDNPLAQIAEEVLITLARSSDVSIQCIERSLDERLMGAVVEKGGKLEVIEYCYQDPKVHYPFGYTGQMAFSFPFFCEMANKNLPLHFVKKKMGEKLFYKGEKFLFDTLKYAKSAKRYCAEKKSCYAPIKNEEDLQRVELLLKERAK